MKLSAKNSSAGSAALCGEARARGVDHRRARRRRRPGSPTGRGSRRAPPGGRGPCGPASASSGAGSDSTGMNVKLRLLLLPLRRAGRAGRDRASRARPSRAPSAARVEVVMQRVLDDRLDRREAGAAGDEDDRLVRLLAQVERAERPFEAQDLAPLELVEELVGEEAAGHVPDVQLEQRVVVRRRREREAAPPAVLQQEVDVLAGEVLQALVRRQLERDDRDVGRRPCRSTRSRQGRRRIWMSPARRTSRTSMHEVGQRLRAAEEREALAPFRRR